MKTSDNYGLNLVEGTDLVNPLVQDVPNYETIDEVMYENACNSVPLATELKSGTVHALTRSKPDASMFRFIATSRYDEGDTFTVDGIQVSGLLTDGTTLSDGAYVINANVLCCLVGTVLTLFTVPGAIQTAQNALKLGGELPSYYGKASDVQTATNTANAAGLLANEATQNVTLLNDRVTAIENTFSLQWKFVGEAIGAADINLPTQFNELLIQVSEGGRSCVLNVAREMLLSTGTNFYVGGGSSNSDNNNTLIWVSTTKAHLTWFVQDSSARTSTAVTRIYYR